MHSLKFNFIVEDIIGITVGAVLLLVVTVVVVTCCVLCCRKSSHDDGGRSTPGLCLVADGSEMHNSLNDIHIGELGYKLHYGSRTMKVKQ